MVHESGRVVLEMVLWPLDLNMAAKVDENKVTCPMLVIGTEEDRITPASVVRLVAEKYSADYKAFEGHAYSVTGEPGWETIADYVLDWLEFKKRCEFELR